MGGYSRPDTATLCSTTRATSSTWLCPVRNAGTGIAYLYGYRLEAEPARQVETGNLDAARHRRGDVAPDPSSFSVQRRDLYVAPGENGFWQAGLHDPGTPGSAPPRSTHSRRSGGSPSTSSTATWKAANERSPVSSASPVRSRPGAAMWLITGGARRSEPLRD